MATKQAAPHSAAKHAPTHAPAKEQDAPEKPQPVTIVPAAAPQVDPSKVKLVSESGSTGDTNAAADTVSGAKDIAAEHNPGASSGALHVQPGFGQIDPIPQGARPVGGGSPVLGEHVPGDTEYKGSRGLKDQSSHGKPPANFVAEKSAGSIQRDAASDATLVGRSAGPRIGKHGSAKGGSIKAQMIVKDVREHGEADTPPSGIVVVLEAAPGVLEGSGVSASGSLTLHVFDQGAADTFAIGATADVTISLKH